jgi:acetyltransferase-like isoleucine patch superfamily enzyme
MLAKYGKKLLSILRRRMFNKYQRHVSLGDLINDRWETAKFMGFGVNTSCYDNVLIIGNVEVGSNCWIGPNVVLDGSGGLTIGNYCSISAGVQIYTHDTVAWSVSLGQMPTVRESTTIGHGVYIGPNAVIQKGVKIGDGAIIGSMAFVNKDVPANAKAFGVPARIIKMEP